MRKTRQGGGIAAWTISAKILSAWTLSAAAILASLGIATPLKAGSPASDLLRDETAAKVPSNWQVHVSTREHALIIFLMPPYQEAFDLWYEPEKLRAKMLTLCPPAGDAIWRHLGPGEIVAIEPTVGGKSAEAMRLTCPHSAPPA